MIEHLKKFFKFLSGFFPNYKGLVSLGYRAAVKNNNFILSKHLETTKISIYQAIEPFDSQLSQHLDFGLEEGIACVVLEFNQPVSEALYEQLVSLFDYTFKRDPYIFMFDRQMELDDQQLTPKMKRIETLLEEGV